MSEMHVFCCERCGEIFKAETEQALLTEAIEIIPCTEAGKASIEGVVDFEC